LSGRETVRQREGIANTMNILVILAHPRKGGFNHAIAQIVIRSLKQNGHTPVFHDLYDERFDPILPGAEIPRDVTLDHMIQQHCDEISSAEGIIIVHPNWWGQPPAILKGWIDRVMRPGIAYEFAEGDSGEGIPVGLLKAKVALVFNTANTSKRREQEVFGDPLEILWGNCIFGLCGITDFHRRTYSVVVTSTEEDRNSWLKDVEQTIGKLFPQ